MDTAWINAPDVGTASERTIVRSIPTAKRTVGLLALQGDFDLHRQMVISLGHDVSEVRTVSELESIDGLIMPGGESTTMRKLVIAEGFYPAIKIFAQSKPVFGTCAGLILLAHLVHAKSEETTMGLLDCDVERNAYGSQYQSFRETGEITLNNSKRTVDMVHIRAPRIVRVGDSVEILGRLHGEPTLVKQGHLLGATFHPELSGDSSIHEYFLSLMS